MDIIKGEIMNREIKALFPVIILDLNIMYQFGIIKINKRRK